MGHHFFFRAGAALLSVSLIIGAVLAPFIYIAKRFPVNRSTSMPVGLYRIVSKRPERGAIIGACLPEEYAKLARKRGYLSQGICPQGIRPVMKFIRAVEGDAVRISWNGVSVNGIPIPNTRVLKTDALGRELPNQIGEHVVQAGEYWLISNHDSASFDSRYFGPVTKVIGVSEPLLTEEALRSFSLINYLLRLGE